MLHSLAVFYRMAVLMLLSAALLPAQQKTDARPQAATPSPGGAKTGPVPLDGQMIIWSGGRTENEAQSQLESFQRYVEALKDFLTVTPLVVESATVEGLKPGFFVVALGVCDEKAARAPLKLFQAIEPSVYARRVHYNAENAAEAPDCPVLVQIAKDGNDDPVYWELGDPVRATTGGGALVALPFSYDWSEQGDFAREYFEVRVELLLTGANRALLDSRQYKSPSDAAKLKSAAATGSSIAWELDYADPPCSPSGDRFVSWNRSFAASAQAGKIAVVRGLARRMNSGSCGYAEEGEMIQGKKKPH
jgi:hypothetical protein